MDHAVHGGAAADAERQRADGDGGERARLAQAARAETEIPGELSHPRKGTHIDSSLVHCTDARRALGLVDLVLLR